MQTNLATSVGSRATPTVVTGLRVAGLLAIAMTYAVLRYVYFGPHVLHEKPAFLLNKALALTASASFLAAAISMRRGSRDAARYYGSGAAHCVFLHVLVSSSLLSATYYPRLYAATGGLSVAGELTVLFGAIGAHAVVCMFTQQRCWLKLSHLPLLSAVSLVGHVAALGSLGWLRPTDWPGGLPPISLISAAMACSTAALLLAPSSGKASEDRS